MTPLDLILSLPPHLRPRPKSIASMRRWSIGSEASARSWTSAGPAFGEMSGSPFMLAREGLGIELGLPLEPHLWQEPASTNLLEDLVLAPPVYLDEVEEESKPLYVDSVESLIDNAEDDQEPAPPPRPKIFIRRIGSVESFGSLGHLSIGASASAETDDRDRTVELEPIAEEDDSASRRQARELDRLFDSALDDMALVDDIKDWLRMTTSDRMKEMMVRAHGFHDVVSFSSVSFLFTANC